MFVSEPKKVDITNLALEKVGGFLPNNKPEETPFELTCNRPKEGPAECLYTSMQIVVDVSCAGKEKKYKSFAKVLLKLKGVRKRVDKSANSEEAWKLFVVKFHTNVIRALREDKLPPNGIKWIIRDSFNANPFVVENELQFKADRVNRAIYDDLLMKKADIDKDFLDDYI